MKATLIQNGKTIDYGNGSGSDIGYNDVVSIGSRIGVAREAIKNGNTGSLSVSGVYEMAADNTAAFSVGDKVYWDGSKLTKTSGAVVAGWVTEPKVLAGATARVKID